MNDQVLNVISILLVLGAVGIVLVGYIAHKMDEADDLLSFTPMDTDPIPDHFQPRAEHIKAVLADLESLRTPLKSYKNMEHAAQYKAHVLERGYPQPDPYTAAHVTDVRMP